MRKQGFSLLEVMLALAISGGIIVGLMQAYRSAERYLRRTNALIRLNRNACLLFNQLERDISTAYMGPFLSEPQAEKQQKESSTKDTDKDKEQLNVFTAISHDAIRAKREGYTLELFKSLSLINTNPLTIAQEHRTRLVRVLYELTENKKPLQAPEHIRYTLTRKESYNLRNNEMKEQTKKTEQPTKFTEIRSHVVAQNIVQLFISYLFMQKDKKPAKPGSQPEDLRLVNTKTAKEKLTTLPYLVEVECTLEDPDEQMQATYRESFPIFAFTLGNTQANAQAPKPSTSPEKQPQENTGGPRAP